jgi:hypothetical protein
LVLNTQTFPLASFSKLPWDTRFLSLSQVLCPGDVGKVSGQMIKFSTIYVQPVIQRRHKLKGGGLKTVGPPCFILSTAENPHKVKIRFAHVCARECGKCNPLSTSFLPHVHSPSYSPPTSHKPTITCLLYYHIFVLIHSVDLQCQVG